MNNLNTRMEDYNKSEFQKIYNLDLKQPDFFSNTQIDPIENYNPSSYDRSKIEQLYNFKSNIDLMEEDINKIINTNLINNTIKDTLVNSNDIKNPQDYINNSLNPEHLALNQYPPPQNLIQNNISKNVYAETLQEYSIIVDSSDRDINKYPNPFNYRVYFNPTDTNVGAYIPMKFNNVKYIKLVTGILPTTFYYVKQEATLNNSDIQILLNLNKTSNPPNSNITLTTTDISGSFVIINITDILINTINKLYERYITFAIPDIFPKSINTTFEYSFKYNLDNSNNIINMVYTSNIAKFTMQLYSISNEKYTLLFIDEYDPPNENATNQTISKSFSIMFPDGTNCDTLYTSSSFVDKIFKFSNLGIINQMTIRITNSNGILFKNSQDNYVDLNIPLIKTCSCLTDTNGYFTRNYQCSCTYFRHPYYQKFQNVLIFKIGVIESNIDTNIFN